MAECCNTFCEAISSATETILNAFTEYWLRNIEPIFEWVSPLGGYVTLPSGQEATSFQTLMSRIAGGLDEGFNLWSWYNKDQPGKTVLILPETPLKPVRVTVNSSMMTRGIDYNVTGSTLTFSIGLSPGDLVLVKSYGG